MKLNPSTDTIEAAKAAVTAKGIDMRGAYDLFLAWLARDVVAQAGASKDPHGNERDNHEIAERLQRAEGRGGMRSAWEELAAILASIEERIPERPSVHGADLEAMARRIVDEALGAETVRRETCPEHGDGCPYCKRKACRGSCVAHAYAKEAESARVLAAQRPADPPEVKDFGARPSGHGSDGTDCASGRGTSHAEAKRPLPAMGQETGNFQPPVAAKDTK